MLSGLHLYDCYFVDFLRTIIDLIEFKSVTLLTFANLWVLATLLIFFWAHGMQNLYLCLPFDEQYWVFVTLSIILSGNIMQNYYLVDLFPKVLWLFHHFVFDFVKLFPSWGKEWILHEGITHVDGNHITRHFWNFFLRKTLNLKRKVRTLIVCKLNFKSLTTITKSYFLTCATATPCLSATTSISFSSESLKWKHSDTSVKQAGLLRWDE